MRPLGDRVIVEIERQEEVRPSGLHLPAQAREKPQVGTVVSVGPEVNMIEVAEGQRVFFSRYGGTEIPDPEAGERASGDRDLILLRLDDILAVDD